MSEIEEVVLVNENGETVGRMPKSQVHGADTPLHLAFSCLLFKRGRLLITRRSMKKRAWPGVWTGSCCGHPAPGEAFQKAISRRLDFELGSEVTDLRVVDSTFRYRAVSSNGIVENEICPVYIGESNGPIRANSDEVMDFEWVAFEDILDVAKKSPFLISPWFALQLQSTWAKTLT